MSLTAEDLWSIRDIIKDEVQDIFHREGKRVIRAVVNKDVREIVHDAVSFELNTVTGKVTALENDVKEIYFILARLEKNISSA